MLPSLLCDSVPQVLDLGVTCMLVHRLVRVFSHVCKGHKPKLNATVPCRVCNRRFDEMGRRCKASKNAPGCVSASSNVYVCFYCCPHAATSECSIESTDYALYCILAPHEPTDMLSAACLQCDSYVHLHRYLVALNELQASFTGEEQRLGLFIVPHAVAKVFSIREPKDGSESNDSDEAAGTKASPARSSRKKHGKGKKGAKPKKKQKSTVSAQRQGAHSQVVQPSETQGAASEDVSDLTSDEGGDSSEDELPPGFSFLLGRVQGRLGGHSFRRRWDGDVLRICGLVRSHCGLDKGYNPPPHDR